VIRNADGKETLVPNSLFLENRVTNLTLSNRRVRRNIKVGVSYGAPPSQVTTILKECAERHGLILAEPSPVVILEDFGDSALIFAIYFWVEFNEKTDASVVGSDVRIMIEKRFEEAGIGFAAARQDMHLNSDQPLLIRMAGREQPGETQPAAPPRLP
jgi:small-conductance mechanosensitive channel